MSQRKNHTIHGKKYKGCLYFFVNSMMGETSAKGRWQRSKRQMADEQGAELKAKVNKFMRSLEEGETPPYPLPNDTDGGILSQLCPSTASSSSAPPAAANVNEEYPMHGEPENEPGHSANPTPPAAP